MLALIFKFDNVRGLFKRLAHVMNSFNSSAINIASQSHSFNTIFTIFTKFRSFAIFVICDIPNVTVSILLSIKWML